MPNDEAKPESPKDENARNAMQHISREIDDNLPTNWGFVLLTFPGEGEPGRLNYASNARVDDVVSLMKEMIEQYDKNPDSWGKHH